MSSKSKTSKVSASTRRETFTAVNTIAALRAQLADLESKEASAKTAKNDAYRKWADKVLANANKTAGGLPNPVPVITVDVVNGTVTFKGDTTASGITRGPSTLKRLGVVDFEVTPKGAKTPIRLKSAMASKALVWLAVNYGGVKNVTKPQDVYGDRSPVRALLSPDFLPLAKSAKLTAVDMSGARIGIDALVLEIARDNPKMVLGATTMR